MFRKLLNDRSFREHPSMYLHSISLGSCHHSFQIHIMRSFFLSCAVLCIIRLVGALPSALSTHPLDDKRLLENRQSAFPTVDINEPLPLDGVCTYSDVRSCNLLRALATDHGQDRTATSSTIVGKTPSLTGKWKKMGDCPHNRVQIKDFGLDHLYVGMYASLTRFEIYWFEFFLQLAERS